MAAHAGLFVPRDTAGNGTSALDARLALGGLIGSVQRCISGGGITASGSNMQFTVAQAVFVLADLDNLGAAMLVPFDSTTLPAIPAGPSSGSRVDSIIVRQQIVGNSLGDTATVALMQTVQGTPSTGTPAPPAIPAGWYEYARITVPANASTAVACSVQVLYPATLGPQPILVANLAAAQLITGITGSLAFGANGITYRCLGGTTWKAWESPWMTYDGGFGGVPSAVTQSTAYRYVEGDVEVKFIVTMNGTGGSGGMSVGLPVPYLTGEAMRQSQVKVVRPGVQTNRASVEPSSYASSTSVNVFVSNASGTYAFDAGVSNGTPLAWAANDYVQGSFMYTPA